ncbi:MAG: aldehyde dehydrogenase family protein [Verrucomicrobiae bacterium]|nr:aldehyde dehydrogenase family protein [Verrucomicrobiae bacterium]MDW8344540.1 aldehyde dehydrogenase family protein [Verrucomicrobiae bacterium]
MSKPCNTQLVIDGVCRDGASGRRMTLVDPAREEAWCEVAVAELADVEAAVAGAQRAFETGWRDLAPGKRAEVLYAVARLIREHLEELAQLEMRNVGKPISDARDEVALGARVFEYYAGAVTKFFGQTIPVARGGFDFTLRQPMGVVAAIVPWNFPFPIACWKVAPALAAGNCVVLKPASLTPLTALRLGVLALEAGMTAGVLQVLSGAGGQIGDALVQHPLVRKISFTGSTSVGSRIMQLASRDIKRVSLELGGKSPNIIFADADLEQAARTSPMSVFANCGQDCCARSRVFVERKVYDRFVELFVAATRQLAVGDPSKEETQVGPMVSAQQRESVERFLDSARQAKRTLACGGDRPHTKGYYLSPTVVLGCETTDWIWREEVFGPVVCVRPFDDEEQMLREVNESPYGLSGSLWTNDLRRALRVARRVESGVLSINSHTSVHVEAPFGGFKQSGLGRDLGMAAMEGYTELKNVYVAL